MIGSQRVPVEMLIRFTEASARKGLTARIVLCAAAKWTVLGVGTPHTPGVLPKCAQLPEYVGVEVLRDSRAVCKYMKIKERRFRAVCKVVKEKELIRPRQNHGGSGSRRSLRGPRAIRLR